MKTLIFLFLIITTSAQAQDSGLPYLKEKMGEKMNYGITDWVTVGWTKLLLDEVKATSDEPREATIPLSMIKDFHPINRSTSRAKLEKREKALANYYPEIKYTGRMSRLWLEMLMPSPKPIQVIQKSANEFLLIEGQGRITAMRNVFGELPGGLDVDVEIYNTKSDRAFDLWEIIRWRRYNKTEAKKSVAGFCKFLFKKNQKLDEMMERK